MQKRNIIFTVTGYGQTRKVVAKTPSAAVYLFRRALVKFERFRKCALAGRGFKEISVEPSLPVIHNIAMLLKPRAAQITQPITTTYARA